METKETSFTDRFITGGKAVSISGLQKNFVMRNLPAVKNEPFMSSAKDYLQRLSFMISEIDYGNGNFVNIHSEWYEVVASLLTDMDFGGQMKKTLSQTVTVAESAIKLDTIDNRIAYIFDYVKENMTWNGQENIYSFDGINKAFKNKTGSSGDINLLLISILNQAGINALPVLLSTRDHGYVNPSLPQINQFNTVMALVENKVGFYLLDASDKNAVYNLYPDRILNTKGFIVESEEGRWLNVIDTINKYKVSTVIRGNINEYGIMEGDALISYTGYARIRPAIFLTTEETKYPDAAIRVDQHNIKIKKQELLNLKKYNLPLEQKLVYSLQLDNSEKATYFKLNLFSNLENSFFKNSERQTDIDFGYEQEYSFYGNYSIPANYDPEYIPDNLSLIMPDTSIVFKRYISVENNSLNVRMTIDFNKSWYSKTAYADFAEFYKLVLSKLNEEVIIKKK